MFKVRFAKNYSIYNYETRRTKHDLRIGFTRTKISYLAIQQHSYKQQIVNSATKSIIYYSKETNILRKLKLIILNQI